jgi:hypothetical protein
MKAFYISIFVLASLFSNAQSNLYNKLNSFLTNQTKEEVSNRLIAINLWSANDKNSRDINIEFEKVYKTYDYARLKGGSKGIIVINLNLGENTATSDITLMKDGVTKSIKLPAHEFEIIKELQGKSAGYNIVFDSNGNKVYENLTTGNVFNSIHQLITR